MPGNSEGIFYSFNLGLAHIISLSTEVYYYTNYGYDQIQTQLNWLKADLKVSGKDLEHYHTNVAGFVCAPRHTSAYGAVCVIIKILR